MILLTFIKERKERKRKKSALIDLKLYSEYRDKYFKIWRILYMYLGNVNVNVIFSNYFSLLCYIILCLCFYFLYVIHLYMKSIILLFSRRRKKIIEINFCCYSILFKCNKYFIEPSIVYFLDGLNFVISKSILYIYFLLVSIFNDCLLI